jgi:hypothetical protein
MSVIGGVRWMRQEWDRREMGVEFGSGSGLARFGGGREGGWRLEGKWRGQRGVIRCEAC